ncbi:MAG: enoyl-CoA hydratase/isomerase family protein [Actinobacteria bacterium]|nr:enoyl-CoA hydratase/isomerase family protein [Actinomycetota bacterium]
MGELVSLDVEDGVGVIRVDNPRLNAISQQVTRELHACIDQVASDDDVRALLVWGGGTIFAAGADVTELQPLGPAEVDPIITRLHDALDALEDLPIVTISAINGFALGGGLELAMSTDLRYAGMGAKLGQPEIQLGIIPGAGGTQRLPRLVGLSRAKDLIFTGRHIKAEEALAIGLVDRVFDDEEVFDRALEDAKAFAKGPTQALRAAKVAIQQGMQTDLRSGLLLEKDLFVGLFATEDQKTGMRSLLEEGPGKATFKGR